MKLSSLTTQNDPFKMSAKIFPKFYSFHYRFTVSNYVWPSKCLPPRMFAMTRRNTFRFHRLNIADVCRRGNSLLQPYPFRSPSLMIFVSSSLDRTAHLSTRTHYNHTQVVHRSNSTCSHTIRTQKLVKVSNIKVFIQSSWHIALNSAPISAGSLYVN